LADARRKLDEFVLSKKDLEQQVEITIAEANLALAKTDLLQHELKQQTRLVNMQTNRVQESEKEAKKRHAVETPESGINGKRVRIGHYL
jgi:hypothetical protein